jgi:sterol desaturase/sphingolipid hydroxylase (fatty acid hydroxylase superfamily)
MTALPSRDRRYNEINLMIFSAWLFGLSLAFMLIERLWPRNPDQPALRRDIWWDFVYLVFNGEYLGVLVGAMAVQLIAWLNHALDLTHLRENLYMGAMTGQPLWLQFVVLLLAFDFLQWCIHNLLHRVPFLWEFHKVHHSIEVMDWIGNWRFHFVEVVVYRSLLYPFAAFFGFDVQAMFWYAVVSVLGGHFAHANLSCPLGPLRYLVNTPDMHAWHHTHPDSGPPDHNFGIVLSVWDWIFGTAYMPHGRMPGRLGFTGIEHYPHNVFGHLVAPIKPGR